MKKERKITRILSFIFAAVLLVSLIGCASTGGSEKKEEKSGQTSEDGVTITLRLAHSNTENHLGNLLCVHFADLVKEKSGGRIEIDIYGNKQLGDDAEVIEQMVSGSLDMVMVSGIVFGNYSDLCTAWQFPFLYDDEDHFEQVSTSDEAKAIMDALTEVGVQGLANYTSYFRNVCSSGPVNSYEDCKDLKIRTAESEMLLDAWKAMGFAPTPMAYGEVYTGLQNGVVDATESDPVGLVNDGYGEVCKYVYETKHYPFIFLLAINPGIFQGLSEEDQEILRDAAQETVSYNIEQVKATTDEFIEKSKDQGVTFVTPTDEEIEHLQELAAPVIQKWCDKDSRIADYVEYARSTSKR